MGNERKQVKGSVLSHRNAKTAVVRVEWLEREREYGKVVRRRKNFVVHDPKDECRVGDTVMIQETRPLSRTKRWLLTQIVERAPQNETEKAGTVK